MSADACCSRSRQYTGNQRPCACYFHALSRQLRLSVTWLKIDRYSFATASAVMVDGVAATFLGPFLNQFRLFDELLPALLVFVVVLSNISAAPSAATWFSSIPFTGADPRPHRGRTTAVPSSRLAET